MSMQPNMELNVAPGAEDGGPFRLGYRRWLDGLRGVAVLVVLAFHFGLLPGGSLGVDVFFVLSGFLITALLLGEWQQYSTISLKNFYLRRALRLLPAFAVVLILCALAISFFQQPGSYWEILVAGCYVANWPRLHEVSMPQLGHTWSLAVEEQFYLVWPLVLFMLLRLRLSKRQLIGAVCFGILASASWRMFLYDLHRDAPDKAANILRLYMGSDTRADALLVGCLTAMLATWNMLPTEKKQLRNLGIGALFAAVALGWLAWYRCLDHSQYYHGLFTGAALLVAVIIVHMLQSPSRVGTTVLEYEPLVAVGRISYGLYLYHIPIILWYGPAGLGYQNPFAVLQVAGLTLAAACASYYLVEKPFLRWKRHFETAATPVKPLPQPIRQAA